MGPTPHQTTRRGFALASEAVSALAVQAGADEREDPAPTSGRRASAFGTRICEPSISGAETEARGREGGAGF